MKDRRFISTILLMAILAIVLVFAGCQKKSLQGTLIENQPPRVSWADQRIDPIFHRAAQLRWFSTDVDGRVLDYDFAVMLQSTVDSLDGPDAVAAHFPVDVRWTIVHKDSATVPLFASPDTGEYVPQYIFLKAMDDDSAFSSIIHTYVERNNHPPTCYVVVPLVGTLTRYSPDPQWCLPETTASWRGIRIAWVGKDSVDIRGLQPDFDWNIRLYGPFPDSASCDTMPGNLHTEFTDATTGSVWIRDKQKFLTDLVTGWYVLYARNRDDAYVPSIPAIGYLTIFEPTWIRHPELTKSILLANHTYFATMAGEIPTALSDSVRQYYEMLLQSAGFDSSDYDWRDYTVVTAEIEPPKADLYNHKLVIAVDGDWERPLLNARAARQAQQDAYGLYLNVGGMLWLMGRRTFEGQELRMGRKDFGVNDDNNPLPYTYLNLSAEFAGPAPGAYRFAEFVGATAIISGFPDLETDTLHVSQTSLGGYRYSRALLGVNYAIRMNESEPLYKYVAINPDTSQFHNFPVAIRYDSGSFKTSYFTFPLYFIQTDQAIEVTRQMLQWFFPNGR